MKKYILPICLWLSLVILIVVGIVISEKTFTSNPNLETYGFIKEAYEDYTKITTRKENLSKDEDLKASICQVYDIHNKDGLVGYMYQVNIPTHSNNEKELSLFAIMDIASKKLVDFKVISCDDKDFYKSYSSDFDKFVEENADLDLTNEKFLEKGSYNAVSGATVTTDAIANAIKLARVQFYIDINEELPMPKLNVVFKGVSQKLAIEVFDEFIGELEVTNSTLNKEIVKVVFKYNFETNVKTFVSSDKTLDADTLNECMNKITAPKDYIKSCTNNEFVVITNMKYGSVFTTTVKVNESGVIESYAVTTSAGFTGHWENRDAESNSFIASVPNTNINDIDSLTYVSGATYTTNAFKNALKLVKSYVALGGAE